MQVKMTPQHMKGPGINIHGPQVTPLVWDLFNYSIASNRIDCRWYKARQAASAFFQGGSDRRFGEWVFIEFWHPDTAADYMDLINAALAFVDDAGRPKVVTFDSDDEELRRWFNGFTTFYEFPVTNTGETSCTFIPTDALAITTLVEKGFTHPTIFTIKEA